jgi:nucleotide-binding universal stress UspA family protein
MSTDRIVVGVDGSPQSKEALRGAWRQAQLTGAQLEAVTAWAYPAMAYPSLSGYVPAESEVDFATDARAGLEQTVKEVLGDAPVRLRVIEGHAAVALLEAAEGASLLVVGSRGHGGFAGVLLGSVSRYVTAHSSCPVVVLRRGTSSPASS